MASSLRATAPYTLLGGAGKAPLVRNVTKHYTAVATREDFEAAAAAETEDARRDNAMAPGDQSETKSDRDFITSDSASVG